MKDGRHARSQRTRAAVAEAMLDCLQAGLLRPSAAEVAERAGVSKRAVFRHFDNMEALLQEIATLQTARVIAQLPRVATDGPLDVRIASLVRNSAERNEIIAPVRRAALLMEPFSEVIQHGHKEVRDQVRRQVRVVFADELAALEEADRRARVATLRALLSFHYWDELRRRERLSSGAARRLLEDAIRTLLQP